MRQEKKILVKMSSLIEEALKDSTPKDDLTMILFEALLGVELVRNVEYNINSDRIAVFVYFDHSTHVIHFLRNEDRGVECTGFDIVGQEK